MKSNKFKTLIGGVALCATFGLSLTANAVVTAPVGYVKLTFDANSDTQFSLPMNRPMVYSGQDTGVTGNVISIANSDFTADEFVYEFTNDDVDNDQRERFYVIFTSGTLEGRSFDVVSNTTNSITVDPDHTEDNTALEDDLETLIDSLSSNDTFEIRPHWTLDTLIPDGEGFPQAATLFASSSTIVTRPLDVDGTNIGIDTPYKYVTNIGWVDNNQLFAGRAFDVILRRNTGFIARNTTNSDVELNVMGDVPTTDATLAFRSNVIDQDTFVSFTFPIDITLEETGLGGSDAFESRSTRFASDGDILALYNNTTSAINQAPSSFYFYIDGTGWIDASNIFGAAVNVTIPAGSVSLVRKSASTEQETLFHGVTLPYDPFAE